MHTPIKAAACCGNVCLHDAKCKNTGVPQVHSRPHLYNKPARPSIKSQHRLHTSNLFDDSDLVVQRVFTDGEWYVKIIEL